MTALGQDQSELVCRLVQIAQARVRAGTTDTGGVAALPEALTALVRTGAPDSQLIDCTVLWLQQLDGVDTAWFQPGDELPGVHEWALPGEVWSVATETGRLLGTAVWDADGVSGSLLTWTEDMGRDVVPVRSALARAAIWLGSVLTTQAAEEADEEDASRQRTLQEVVVSTVSHEVRTPLTVLVGGLEMLADGDLGPVTETQAHLVERMRAASRRIAVMADDLASLAARESPRIGPPTPRTSIPVGLVIREALRRLDQEDRVRLEIGPERVAVCEETLTRILYRIGDNALAVSGPEDTVRVRTRSEGALTVIEVSDTGGGIEADELEHIGTPFFRTRRSLAAGASSPGAGLGVAVARRLTEEAGGSLELDTEWGVGTRVLVRLPAEPVSDA